MTPTSNKSNKSSNSYNNRGIIAFPKKGPPKLTPLIHSRASTLDYTNTPTTGSLGDSERNSSLPPMTQLYDRRSDSLKTSDRRSSLVSDSIRMFDTQKRGAAVGLPREKKGEFLSTLKDHKQLLTTTMLAQPNERKTSVTTTQGGMSLVQEFSMDGSFSRESDDFVDNLTKQKMNLQLKSVADRMYEVCVCVLKRSPFR